MNHYAKPVDFFARQPHYVDHLAPIWMAMDETMRGSFYVPASLEEHARARGIDATVVRSRGSNNPNLVLPGGDGPLVVCGYGDMQIAHRKQGKRPIILLEHGIGLTFNHPAYAGGRGMRNAVSLFLDPNEHTRARNARTYPNTPGCVIGTPKMDVILDPLRPSGTSPKYPQSAREFGGGKPVVCISFHWDGKHIAAEAGNALEFYKSVLPQLAACEDFTLIGHGHPRIANQLERLYGGLGIEYVRDFAEVMERADLYVNDCSSTMYEFCAAGKPVIILNTPRFRKNIHHGIRFWEYADVGPQVEAPQELRGAIREQLSAISQGNDAYEIARAKAVQDLYPYWGCAAERAAEIIQEFVASKCPAPRVFDSVDGESVGILYVGFGLKAARSIAASMATLKGIGLEIPVCVVGDTPVKGAQFIEWQGQSPFDAECRENFQFRAGRIKPGLYALSPFDRTLYIDADTEFISDITPGFAMLSEFDMALAEESMSIGKLYNKPRAGWEINIQERNVTIKELGGDPNTKFLNSGVLFFRKCMDVEAVFEEWAKEWHRFQQWDEQLALMRAMFKYGVKHKALSIDWNHPHRDKAKIIFHNYGRGVVRQNVAEVQMAEGSEVQMFKGSDVQRRTA